MLDEKQFTEPVPKSVLDGTPVVNAAFKSFEDYVGNPASITFGSSAPMKVMSTCPRCGSPIYGPETAPAGLAPTVYRTCNCAAHGHGPYPDKGGLPGVRHT